MFLHRDNKLAHATVGGATVTKPDKMQPHIRSHLPTLGTLELYPPHNTYTLHPTNMESCLNIWYIYTVQYRAVANIMVAQGWLWFWWDNPEWML